MWLFSLKLSGNASVIPHSVGHGRSDTVQMEICKVYNGSPVLMLLFAPHILPFSRNDILQLSLYGLPVVIPVPSCGTIK